ncbi:hypothetical protein FEV09_21590 [Pseudanabaena catenata USMAC16]|uniref:Uncharacterized protein n=1 Tax=Pseudanabaena catenata USMAC16 TaxID=1855837 RepID=A0A9X4MDI7_9CYAN|nr:hypothetical protein [Pseudanabaena catenata]MDG3497137.1 hypothetical protein [Pseudanabaena catenata USMAC16]
MLRYLAILNELWDVTSLSHRDVMLESQMPKDHGLFFGCPYS